MTPLWSFFVCCVIAIASANTILSPIFGNTDQDGQYFDVLDQGRINHISWSFGTCGVFAIDDWNADSRMPDKETQFGTGGTDGTASNFTLDPDEYVTGVVARFGAGCPARACTGLEVTTSASVEHTITGLIEGDPYPSLHNNSYYLSGWNVWVAGFFGGDYIAGIQWQFTELNTTPISPPTASATSSTPLPSTAAPSTPLPTSASPTTASPTTPSPTTASPTTASPTTKSPTTSYVEVRLTVEKDGTHGSVQEQADQAIEAKQFPRGVWVALCVFAVLLLLCAFAGVYFWKFHRSDSKAGAQEPEQIDMAARHQVADPPSPVKAPRPQVQLHDVAEQIVSVDSQSVVSHPQMVVADNDDERKQGEEDVELSMPSVEKVKEQFVYDPNRNYKPEGERASIITPGVNRDVVAEDPEESDSEELYVVDNNNNNKQSNATTMPMPSDNDISNPTHLDTADNAKKDAGAPTLF